MGARDQRFPSRHRLTTQGEFQRVFQAPVKSTHRCVTALARKNDCGTARIGLAISKKNVKKAVARNRIKRVIRESFRHHRQSLGSYDIVILGRHGIDALDNGELRAALEAHWKKLGPCKDC